MQFKFIKLPNNTQSKKPAWKQVANSAEGSTCHLLSRWFLARLIFGPWIWRRYVLPKRLLTFNGLQGLMFRMIELFTTTAARTRTPTWWNFTQVSEDHSAFFFRYLFYREDGGSRLFLNVENLPGYTSHLERSKSSLSPLWEPQISQVSIILDEKLTRRSKALLENSIVSQLVKK
jgi:hypothetical protein